MRRGVKSTCWCMRRGWRRRQTWPSPPSSWQSPVASSRRTGWQWRPGTGWSWRTIQSKHKNIVWTISKKSEMCVIVWKEKTSVANITTHCTENPFYVFPEMELRDLVPSSYIHVSVSDLYIPRIGLPIWLQQNRQTDPGIVNRYMNLEIGRPNIIILF